MYSRRPDRRDATHRDATHPAMCVPVRIYRFAHIRSLRALLRVKVLQLGAGVGVGFPVVTALSTGGLPTAAEGAAVAAIAGGTIAVGASLSWYCERLVGELNWLPKAQSLRISTLTMWGQRLDSDVSAEQLAQDGYTKPVISPGAPASAPSYPSTGLNPLQLNGKTYIFVWGARHVQQPEALARLLVRNEMPFPLVSAEQSPGPGTNQDQVRI